MHKSAKDNKILKVFMIILTAGYIVFILSNSLKPASVSGANSQSIVDVINSFFKILNLNIVLTNHIIRKTAHFAEFFLLGIITTSAFRVFTKTPYKNIFTILFIGLATAVSDETVQIFVDGRGSQVSDVLLDFSGVLAGTLIALLFYIVMARHKKKKEEKNCGKHIIKDDSAENPPLP